MSDLSNNSIRRVHGYFEAIRNDEVLDLISHNKHAFILLYIIAYRANWDDTKFNSHNLQFGEALLGDYQRYDMTQGQYRSAKKKLEKHRFATFKATSQGTIAKLVDTRIFKINPPSKDGQKTLNQRPRNEPITTNLNLKTIKPESHKAYSTKNTNKLAGGQKELADLIQELLGEQWVNDAGKWINRIKEQPRKCERVFAEVGNAIKEGRIKTTPAQYAEETWKHFA
jgi:hypothetical protein